MDSQSKGWVDHFAENDVVLVGEGHSNGENILFIAEGLPKLKEKGFTTLFLETPAFDRTKEEETPHAKLIDAFYKGDVSEEDFPKRFFEIAKQFNEEKWKDAGFPIEHPKTFPEEIASKANLIVSAKQANIRVVLVDVWEDFRGKPNDYVFRTRDNFIAEKIKENHHHGKSIGIFGLDHIVGYEDDPQRETLTQVIQKQHSQAKVLSLCSAGGAELRGDRFEKYRMKLRKHYEVTSFDCAETQLIERKNGTLLIHPIKGAEASKVTERMSNLERSILDCQITPTTKKKPTNIPRPDKSGESVTSLKGHLPDVND
jgi:hypothetical protein